MEKSIEITLTEAQQLYNDCPELRPFLLTKFSKRDLEPSSLWEQLGVIDGWWIDGNSTIELIHNRRTIDRNKNIFATYKQANSALAMAQLSQLLKQFNKDWVEGDDGKVYKIIRSQNVIEITGLQVIYSFLKFPSKYRAQLFLEQNILLLKKYFELE